jgi:hypothetical protein
MENRFCQIQDISQRKLEAVILPDQKRYSALLKKVNTRNEKFLVFLDAARNKIEYTHIKKKAL